MMNARHEGLLMIGILVLLSFVFQLQMKLFANELAPLLKQFNHGLAANLGSFVAIAIGWRPLFILFLASMLFLIWLLVLTRLELSLALPLASVALVVNSVGTGIWLGESLTILRVLGIISVAIGIMLVLKS